MRHGLKKVAVYRDRAGRRTNDTAECPHLKLCGGMDANRADMGLPMSWFAVWLRRPCLPNRPANVDLAPVGEEA